MIDYILTYFLIGVLFTLIMDLGNAYYNNQAEYRDDSINFSNLERTTLIIIWPYGLILMIMLLIKNSKE